MTSIPQNYLYAKEVITHIEKLILDSSKVMLCVLMCQTLGTPSEHDAEKKAQVFCL